MDPHQLAQAVEELSIGVVRLRQVNVSIQKCLDCRLWTQRIFSLWTVCDALASVQVRLLMAMRQKAASITILVSNHLYSLNTIRKNALCRLLTGC